ncbi:MAG: SgcJ/EcaC family oxidoreductase [Pirellulales bacterium]
MIRSVTYVKLSLVATLLTPALLMGQDAPDQAKEEATIQKVGAEYVKAFNKRDTATLAAFWSPEAVYTNRLTGEQVVGREAIAQQFTATFEAANELKLDVRVESLQFISPNVAVEHGVAKFLSPQSEPEEIDYSAVYVRRDGKWLLDRVTDDPTPEVKTQYEHLKELEWMIGSWVDDDENARIVTECNWTKNKNFITRSFTVSIDDRIDMSGMQIIGWDPAAEQIRSWVFDSAGGFAEGTWTRKEDRWMIRKRGVLANGQQTTATNMIRYVDDNTCTVQSVGRTVDGELLPNIDEVYVVRADAVDAS